MSTVTIPKELYLGRKQEKDRQSNEITMLGFLTPADKKDAAFEKRKDTIDTWAGKKYWTDIDLIGGIYIQNDLLEGFKIAQAVRRVYWGGGNVLWRIEDPRGFEIEISSANLASIIELNGIEKGGVISGKCCYGRLGAENVLLPENSEPYLEAVEATDSINNKKYSAKDLKPGDIVKIKSEAKLVQYLGHLYYVHLESYYVNNEHKGEKVSQSDEKVHVFRKIDTDNYFIGFKTPTVISIKDNKKLPELKCRAFIYKNHYHYDTIFVDKPNLRLEIYFEPKDNKIIDHRKEYFKIKDIFYRLGNYGYYELFKKPVPANPIREIHKTNIEFTSSSYYNRNLVDVPIDTVFYDLKYRILE